MPRDDDALLTEAELARELGKSRRTLQRWRQVGMGPRVTRIGKSPRYRWGDVRTWLREQGEEPAGG